MKKTVRQEMVAKFGRDPGSVEICIVIYNFAFCCSSSYVRVSDRATIVKIERGIHNVA